MSPPVAPTTRRGFLKGVGVAAAATAVLPAMAQEGAAPADKTPAVPGLKELGREARTITLRINGKPRELRVEPRTTLLEALREGADLTGSKQICDRGACGGCTVMLGDRTVNSCMALAIDAVGHEVTTIEGIAADPAYANVIEAYCDNDAAQCGFCIPGFVVSTCALLKANPKPDDAAIAAGLAGNLCRCGTHEMIRRAVHDAAARGGVA